MKNKIIGIGVAMFCVVMSMAQSNNVIDEVALEPFCALTTEIGVVF